MSNETGGWSRRTVVAAAAGAAAGVTVGGASPAAARAEPSLPLRSQVALITGAARGIGRAAAVALAEAGADIVAVDVAAQAIELDYDLATRADLAETGRLVRRTRRRCLTIEADVRDAGLMHDAVERTVAEFGRIDIVVPNAGIVSYHPLAELTSKQWADVIDVNLTGVANTIRPAIPHLTAQRQGAIVVTGSTEGRHGAPQLTHYCAAKWGVIGLVKSLAVELGPANVRVNAVAPTGVRTPLVLNEVTYRWAGGTGPEALEAALRNYNTLPVGLLEPVDVAAAITFLASPAARHVSGTVLDVSAGASSRWNA